MTEPKKTLTLSQLKEQPHYSYSALNTYLNICQLQYRYRYIDKLEAERTPVALPFGSAFHATLSEMAQSAKRGNAIPASQLKETFATYFHAALADSPNVLFKDDQTEDSLVDLAGRMLEAVTSEWPDWFNCVDGVAVPFSMDIGLSKPVIGEYDLVLKEPGAFDEPGVASQVTIVDWKTAARSWTPDRAEKELQATVYTAAYQQEHGQLPWFRYDVVTKAKIPKVSRYHTARNEDQIDRMKHLLRSADQAIQAGIFLPNETSFACAECPYAGTCSGWHCNCNHQQVKEVA